MKLVFFYLMVYFYHSIDQVCSDVFTLSDYTLEWIEMEEEMEFKLNTIVEDSDKIWTSFALSFDNQMGNDNALICKMYGTERKVDHAFNNGTSRPSLLSDQNPSIGLTNINVQLVDNNLTCSFRRQKIFSNINNYFDSNSNYYILFAKGKTQDNGVINYHFNNKISSSSSLSLNSNSDKDQPTFISTETTTKIGDNTNLPTTQTFTTEINQFGEFSIGDFSLQWENNDDNINFTFVTKNKEKQSLFYSAFAFSKDSFMGQDDVIACKVTSNSQYLVERYYNQGKSQPSYLTAENKNIGISEPKVSFSDGILTCSLMIEKSNPNVPNYSDLSNGNKWYILFAYGNLDSSGELEIHSDKKAGTQLIDFTINKVQTTTKRLTSAKPIGDVTANGSFSSGGYSLSWLNTQYYTIFSGGNGNVAAKNIRSKRQNSNGNRYIAFGLSDDKEMGNDCIIVCKMFNGVGTVEHYYSTGKFTPGLLKPDEPKIGITDATVTNVNGNLFCKFTREKYIDGVDRYCDSSKNSYYLLIAEGAVSNDIIQNHGQSYVISDTKIDFSANGTFLGSSRDSAKAKAHACIMVFAWLFCVSTGIILARYYKYIFPSFKIQKMMFWFQAHRALMIFAPICSIAAFLVILADLEWKWVEKVNKVAFAHSIFGIVLIALSLIQVLMGFLRPDKDSKFRFLFNLIHRFTGISCLIFAVVACYLGVFIERMNLGDEGWGIMVGWTLWVIILPLLIEIIQLTCSNSKSNSYELKADEAVSELKNNKKLMENVKTFLLILHIIIALGHVVALMVVIGIAEPTKKLIN